VNEEVQMRIADVIREHRPTVILTHWKGERFTGDHNISYTNTLAPSFCRLCARFSRITLALAEAHVTSPRTGKTWKGSNEIYLDPPMSSPLHPRHPRYSLFRGVVVSFRYEQ
jgi:hypothetical protein